MKHITIPSQRHITLGAIGMVLLAAIVYFACLSSSDIREDILSGNYHAAFQAALRKAEKGESDSQNTLGNLYYLGLGTKRSYRAAARWYVKAALQNYGPAQANLGHLYNQGLGVPKDVVRTLGWYLLATKSGYKDIDDLLKRTTQENHFNPNMIAQARSLFSSLENVKKNLADELEAIAKQTN